MNSIIVLGAGLVGRAMALDLASDDTNRVTSIDRNSKALAALPEEIETRKMDVGDSKALTNAIAGADLVVCAVPGFMGYRTLRTIIESGCNVVDISFFPENALDLEEIAQANNVIAVVDCGVAPGLSNILAGHVSTILDETTAYTCYVGGLPVVRTWPYEYRAVFSPIDVIEEYTRPARFVRNGQVITKEALSDIELHEFPSVGTLESFNSDGLRSLIFTMDIPDMIEKTLRYPGHANLMRTYRESGFFDEKPLLIDGTMVRPIDVTSHLLFKEWKLPDGEADMTVMRVIVDGFVNGKQVRYTYDLLDYLDEQTGIHSMARTTGYTATLVARMVLDGTFSRVGINPPEYVGKTSGCMDKLLEGYSERDISVSSSVTALE